MNLGKPLKTVIVRQPARTADAPASVPAENWPIPLPAEWPVRRTADAPLTPAEPARPERSARHA